MAGLSLH